MDFFDDVDDESSSSQAAGAEVGVYDAAHLNTVYIEVMKLKPFLKRKGTELMTTEVLLPRELAIVSDDGSEAAQLVPFLGKFKAAKFSPKSSSANDFLASTHLLDVVVLFSLPTEEMVRKCEVSLMPGGSLILIGPSADIASAFPVFDWVLSEASSDANRMAVHVLQKRRIHCNEIGAIYWHPIPTPENRKMSRAIADRERAWIEKVAVSISVAEYETGIFSDATHSRAVSNILQYGVCLFPHLFDAVETKDWGRHAMEDMGSIVSTLLRDKSIDLLHPSAANPRIENYHELSMREALRCDLRNGRRMKQKASQVYGVEVPPRVSSAKVPTNYHTHLPPKHNLRFHPAIRAVLLEAMNPPAPTEHERKGNWGRYNFEGPGPEVVPEPRIGNIGVVMSLPGCADQTIHADTSHTYVHTQLPPHYLNLFTPAIDRPSSSGLSAGGCVVTEERNGHSVQYESFPVGQTAFVVGSHTLDMCGRVMTTEEGQSLLEERLIRPQLAAGDALIFDCRVLHFGLANQAPLDEAGGTEGWRPMVYVNYHQEWFHDPKNWNDNERLFPEEPR